MGQDVAFTQLCFILYRMAKLKRMSAEDLENLADRITYIADRYAKVAIEMRERGIPFLEISGIDTVKDEIIPNRLSANAGSAERALHRWDGTPEPTKPAANVNLAADANEAFRKSNARAKKKGS